MMTEKELTEEVRIAKLAAILSIGVSLIALAEIMFFSLLMLKGAVGQ